MLQPLSQLPQDIAFNCIMLEWCALDTESGAWLRRSSGRSRFGSKTRYYLFVPNKTVEERGGLFENRLAWDNDGRKIISAWNDREALAIANRKLSKILEERLQRES